jgi:hypothetical protein
MRVVLPALALLASLPALPQARVDPKAISIHPFTGQRGTTFAATLRGSGLTGARVAPIAGSPLSITVEQVEQEAPGVASGRSKTPVDLVKLRIEVAGDAKPGRYPIRLIARNGISNALSLHVVDLPVAPEPDGVHESPETAVPASTTPVVFTGRLSRRGEADFYEFRAEAGQTLTFDVISGLPQIAAGGSAATIANFDPSLSIYHAEGSWFDSARLKRIAYNDEPVWVIGKSTDAHLTHRFSKSGTFLLRVEAFAGQGGPDYSYQLRIAPGELPQSLAPETKDWDERSWIRRLHSDRLNELSARGGKLRDQKSIETYRGMPEATAFKLPGTIEGSLLAPGEAHRARFQLDKPADIAMEFETPAAYPPFFNPIVRLLNGSGEEVATNIFAGKGACSGAMTKSMQVKTIVPLRDPGEYTVEVRDATSDIAGPDFQYRLQVRPQIPHVGDVRIDTDHVNLAPGEAKTVRVIFDREEDYRGAITVIAEGLPAGVSAAVGADFEPDKDPPSSAGKRERYTSRAERAVVVLSAAPDAPPAVEPSRIRLIVRPLVDGRLGDVLSTKTIYMMVIDKT